jgi:hypothetical protein
MAIASFVTGLLGASVLFFIGSIFAVVFGHIALQQIKGSDNGLGGKALAVSGLVLGYVVLIGTSIVAIAVACVLVMRDAGA